MLSLKKISSPGELNRVPWSSHNVFGIDRDAFTHFENFHRSFCPHRGVVAWSSACQAAERPSRDPVIGFLFPRASAGSLFSRQTVSRRTEVDISMRHCKDRLVKRRRFMLLVALTCLLLNALGCYGAWMTAPAARKCCASGHCSPSNRDSCCKSLPAGNGQTLEAQSPTSVPAPISTPAIFDIQPVALPAFRQLERFLNLADSSPPPHRALSDSHLSLRI